MPHATLVLLHAQYEPTQLDANPHSLMQYVQLSTHDWSLAVWCRRWKRGYKNVIGKGIELNKAGTDTPS